MACRAPYTLADVVIAQLPEQPLRTHHTCNGMWESPGRPLLPLLAMRLASRAGSELPVNGKETGPTWTRHPERRRRFR